MKVNMTPNPLDVVTIHASQGDTEARQWEFELHNNGELIDTSEVTEQLFFKAYKGGTEQILPENGAVPVTAPFVGDIKYPDAMRNDQEFLYRQSPTEKDGLAKITDIKGNTLVWNQLVQNGNFADTTGWSLSDSVSLSVANNVLTATIGTTHHSSIRLTKTNFLMTSGKKYLFMCDVKASKNINVRFQYDGVATGITTQTMIANVWNRYASFATMTANNLTTLYYNVGNNLTEGDTVQFRNCVLFDLSLMGLDITDPSDFTSLFPLSYYSYNQGSLLSFNGNGIKTVGKNLCDNNSQIHLMVSSSGVLISEPGSDLYYFRTDFDTQMSISVDISKISDRVIRYGYFNELPTSVGVTGIRETLSGSTYPRTITLNQNYKYVAFAFLWVNSSDKADIQIEYGSPTSYEPYEEFITPLPISTYFPTGMKSAGNVYDELTENKAITRVGMVDMGTLSWTRNSNYEFFYATLTDGAIFTGADDKDLLCPIYTTETTVNSTSLMSNVNDKTIRGRRGIASCQIYIKDTSYTSATDLVNALQGIPLYYELATPTETSFTTASLVTENAEIPLSNNDGVLIGKCTEQLSENPCFIDAKIKLTDSDGTCYSNKLQLHVERSPQ